MPPELNGLEDVFALLKRTLASDPPLSLNEGGVIGQGVDARLDELRALARQGKIWVSELQQDLRRQTGIASLKVGFNRVFGYYIEVSKTHQNKVPDNFIRKQTLAGGERYITLDLKEKESSILSAEEDALAMESSLFQQLRQAVAARSAGLMNCSRMLARLDVLAALARLALDKAYVRPTLGQAGGPLQIAGGRHPVVEDMMPAGEFVPNDVTLDSEQQILNITGPNMAGKSTILRQMAIIAIMAHMGSFVPAQSAAIPILDRIFTRVGALDNLAKGQSTFMVEMAETSQILKDATPNSLVILDEVGRGTSTFDGLALAWAVVEFLHDLKGAGVKTMFATHYHELVELGQSCPRVRNFNVEVKEFRGNIVFMRRLAPGGVSRSYGLQVAKLAGLPGEVLKRAQTILSQLEQGKPLGQEGLHSPQMPLFSAAPPHPVLNTLRHLNISALTPLQALNLLEDMQRDLD
jgi:DNA mismatch repair protein MutS